MKQPPICLVGSRWSYVNVKCKRSLRCWYWYSCSSILSDTIHKNSKISRFNFGSIFKAWEVVLALHLLWFKCQSQPEIGLKVIIYKKKLKCVNFFINVVPWSWSIQSISHFKCDVVQLILSLTIIMLIENKIISVIKNFFLNDKFSLVKIKIKK